MSAVETPQPLLRKKSLFRRFSRRESSASYAPALPSPTLQTPGPRKLQQRLTVAPSDVLTPPDTPKSHNSFTSQSHKPNMFTHIQQVDFTSTKPAPPARTDSHHSTSRSHHSRRVLPTALSTTPFPGTPLIRPWNVFLLPSQIFLLYLGFLPQDMSDKWFIYSEGPDQAGKLKIHFHTSWTGMKIAELFVVMDIKGEGAGKLVGIKWNGSADTNRMTEEEAKYMIRTTCQWTLGVELEER